MLLGCLKVKTSHSYALRDFSGAYRDTGDAEGQAFGVGDRGPFSDARGKKLAGNLWSGTAAGVKAHIIFGI